MTVGHFALDFINLPGKPCSRPRVGGPPTYTSLGARRIGTRVSVISKVGKDFSTKYIGWLESQGINLAGLKKIEDSSTTSFFLNYSELGERQLILRSKAPPIYLQDIPSFLETKAVHIAPIANEIDYNVAGKLKDLAGIVSLDPQGFLRRFGEAGRTSLAKIERPEILEGIDVFKASEEEIAALTAEPDTLRAVNKIKNYGMRIIIVTRGSEGSLLYTSGRSYKVPAARARAVVDTTGAGDVFIGAFLAEYLREKESIWCASVGSAAASFVAEKVGPTGFASQKRVYERAVQVYDKTRTIA